MIAEAIDTTPELGPHRDFHTDRPPRVVFGMVNEDGSPILWYYDEERWRTITRIQVLKHRFRVKRATEGTDVASMDARALQRKLCERDGPDGLIYWLATFGWILEPRNDGINTKLPFIPFPRQLDLIDWYYWVMEQDLGRTSSGLVEKSRSVGATWIDAAHTAKHWQFDRTMFVAGVISKTDELVDNKGDPSSYFWKLQYLLTQQEDWLLPEGFAGFHERSPHRSHGKLINPRTDSVVVGSTTTDLSFVGARLRKLTIDEAATLEGFDEVWSNTASVTDHRFAITTPRTRHTMGVFNLRFGSEGYVTPSLFSFRWYEVPGRDEWWLHGMRESMQSDRFEREIMLNWRADQGEFGFPQSHDMVASNDYEPVPGWPVIVGIDDGWDDEFSITWMQHDVLNNRYRIIGNYSNRGKPMSFYGHILTGGALLPEGAEASGGYPFVREDWEYMRWVRKHGLRNATYYGDRHGANTDLSSGSSPFETLTNQTGIYVMVSTDPAHNDQKYRVDAVQEALPRMEFWTHMGAKTVLWALQNSRYPRKRDTAQPTSEVRGLIHDATSHPRATLEYIMIGLKTAQAPFRRKKNNPTRSVSGWRTPPQRHGRRTSGTILGGVR